MITYYSINSTKPSSSFRTSLFNRLQFGRQTIPSKFLSLYFYKESVCIKLSDNWIETIGRDTSFFTSSTNRQTFCFVSFSSKFCLALLKLWNLLQHLFRLLVGQIDGLLPTVSVPGPQLGVGRLDGDVVLLHELANSGAGRRLLAEVKPKFFQGRRKLDGFRGHCHSGASSKTMAMNENKISNLLSQMKWSLSFCSVSNKGPY